MQKYHDEPKQYKGYLKSALTLPRRRWLTADDNWRQNTEVERPTPPAAQSACTYDRARVVR